MLYRIKFNLNFEKLSDASAALTYAMQRAEMAKSGIKQDQERGSEATELGVQGIDGGWRVGYNFFFEDSEGFDAEAYAKATCYKLQEYLADCLEDTETRVSLVDAHECHNDINKPCAPVDW